MKKQLILGALLSTAFLSSGSVWAVTADDVDCSGCIQGDEIAKKAITNSKIKSGAVSNSKIKNNAVSSSKIKNNAVSTDKIKDRAVTPEKLSDEVYDAIEAGRTLTLVVLSATDEILPILVTHFDSNPRPGDSLGVYGFLDYGDGIPIPVFVGRNELTGRNSSVYFDAPNCTGNAYVLDQFSANVSLVSPIYTLHGTSVYATEGTEKLPELLFLSRQSEEGFCDANQQGTKINIPPATYIGEANIPAPPYRIEFR